MTEMVSGGCSMFETSRQSDYHTGYINGIDASFEQHPNATPKTRLSGVCCISRPSPHSLFHHPILQHVPITIALSDKNL